MSERPTTIIGYGVYLGNGTIYEDGECEEVDPNGALDDLDAAAVKLALAFGVEPPGYYFDLDRTGCPVLLIHEEVGDSEHALIIADTHMAWDWDDNGRAVDVKRLTPPADADAKLARALSAIGLDPKLARRARVLAINYNG